MRVDDELVAAHIGVRSRNTVLVGMPAQSPRHARHSVGKILFYELALLLEQEGIDALDLTPGGEYKDRFATHFDEASVLTIFFSHAAAWRYRQQRRLIDAAKRRGVSTDAVKRALRAARHTVRHVRPANVPMQAVRRIKRATWGALELRLYRFPRGKPVVQPQWFRVERDRIEDLACYVPVERWQPSFGTFLQTASERLEQGEHCYTYAEDGVLAHFGWLIERQESTFLDEVNQRWTLPPGSAVLYGFYTDPRFRGRGIYASSLARMIGDARNIPGVGEIYISVLADNGPSRRVIEKLGFDYERSFHERRQFARVRRWSAVPRRGAPAQA